MFDVLCSPKQRSAESTIYLYIKLQQSLDFWYWSL